MTNCRY